MASFGDLPVEVINNICLHLRQQLLGGKLKNLDRSSLPLRGTLANLCRTSKKLYEIALPHLYYGILVGQHGALLYHLAQTLLRTQRLANLVCQLEVEDLELPPRFGDRWSGSNGLQNLDEIGRLRGTTTFDTEAVSSCFRDIMGSCQEPSSWRGMFLYLILTRLSNLKVLSIQLPRENNSDLCWRIIGNWHRKDPIFLPQLRDVVLDTWEADRPLCMRDFVDLLRHRDIERLCIPYYLLLDAEIEESIPSVLELRLLAEDVDHNGFVRLASWFPNLELLQYEGIDANLENAETPYYATMTELALALYPLRKTLHTLILHHGLIVDTAIGGELRSLADFQSLRNLMISLLFLTTKRCDKPILLGDTLLENDGLEALMPWWGPLPSSIENLCFIGTRTPMQHGLRSWIGGMKDELPNLKSLVVDVELTPATDLVGLGVYYQEVEFMSMIHRRTDDGRKWEDFLAAVGHTT